MLNIDIPGFKRIQAEHLVLDYNGTLAIDGLFIEGVLGQIADISTILSVHVLTADTFSTVQKELRDLPITIKIMESDNQDEQKFEYVKNLGFNKVIAIGNGRNDVLMLKESALSIGIIQAEGAYCEVVKCSQIICTNIIDALQLLKNPKRLLATLRS